MCYHYYHRFFKKGEGVVQPTWIFDTKDPIPSYIEEKKNVILLFVIFARLCLDANKYQIFIIFMNQYSTYGVTTACF